jgi:gas vesicle protein
MREHHRAARASLWGFAIGGAVGFSLGLLLAPDEGRQVRQRLAYLFERWSGQVASVMEGLLDESAPSVARQKADAVVADARQQAEQLLSEAEALMNEARSRRAGRAGDHPEDGSGTLRRVS